MTTAERNIEIRKLNRQRKLRRDITKIVLASFLTLMIIACMIVKSNNKGPEVIPEGYEQVSVYIKEGDRAWNIQSKLTPNENTSKMLYYAEIANNKKMGNIKAGEEVQFIVKSN